MVRDVISSCSLKIDLRANSSFLTINESPLIWIHQLFDSLKNLSLIEMYEKLKDLIKVWTKSHI